MNPQQEPTEYFHGKTPRHLEVARVFRQKRPGLYRIALLAAILLALASVFLYASPAKKQTEPSKNPAAFASVNDGPAQIQDHGADVDAIGRIIARYAQSIDAADTTMASQLWWDSPEVSFIHPLGHEHGFDQVKQNVYKRLMGETFSERKLTPRDITIHVYGDAAWSEFYWDFNAQFRKDGRPIATHGRETQIYRKIQGTWRIIHVHYSGMPATELGQGF
jgi:ketosteroid isomerase-like protein